MFPPYRAAPNPRPWPAALDPLADVVMRLTAGHLDRHARTLGVDDFAQIEAATMNVVVRLAVAVAVDEWVTTHPVSMGGLVLDVLPPSEAAA